jgi:chaperonin GroES
MSENTDDGREMAAEINRQLAEDAERMTIRPPTRRIDPMGDCIVFRPVPADRTEAGLYIPDKGREAETRLRAIVVAVGPGKRREDGSFRRMTVKVGDRLLLWPTAPTPGGTDETGERLYLCREDEVAARIVEVE